MSGLKDLKKALDAKNKKPSSPAVSLEPTATEEKKKKTPYSTSTGGRSLLGG